MNTHPLVGFLIVCFAAIVLFFSTAVGHGPVPSPSDGDSDTATHSPAPGKCPARESPKSK